MEVEYIGFFFFFCPFSLTNDKDLRVKFEKPIEKRSDHQ